MRANVDAQHDEGSEGMDFRIDIVAAGDATSREIAEVTRSVRDALERSRDVDNVAQSRAEAPAGAKGWIDEIGSLLLNLPSSEVVIAVLGLVRAVASRQNVPVTIKISREGVESSFDPRSITPEKMQALAGELMRQWAAIPAKGA
jgi:hypothetical protein